MKHSYSSLTYAAFVAGTLSIFSTSSFAAAVTVGGTWDSGNIVTAGGSITSSGQNSATNSFTSNPTLDGAGWGHQGTWYTFHTHAGAQTKVMIQASDATGLAPAFTLWKTDGVFDGGEATGSGDGQSSAARGVPHSFNQVGDVGDLGNRWMTDDSVGGNTANGITERIGYSSDAAYSENGWGNVINADANPGDGMTMLTFTSTQHGWYTLFVGGADGGLSGAGNLNLSVSQVPLPAAVYLFGSALLGLSAMKRKKLALQEA